MTEANHNWPPIPKGSVRAYRQRVLDQAASYRDQVAQSLQLSVGIVAKARDLIERTRKNLGLTERLAHKERPAENIATKGKSERIPYSVATNTVEALELNRELQAQGHALLAKNRELRQSIKMKLQRHRNSLRRANKR